MIQTIIHNHDTGQTAIAELPESRMNLAGMLASVGIRKPATEISCRDDGEGGIQVKLSGADRFGAQIVAAVRDTDTLFSVNAVCEMFCSLPYSRQQELREDIEQNGVASLKVFAEKMAHLDRSDMTVSYYCPLTADLFNRYESDSYEIDSAALVRYEDQIRASLKREQEGENRASYFDEDNGAVSKLRSVEWDVESIRGELYGKITARLTEPFSDEEEAAFLAWCEGQNSDGLGEVFEQREIPINSGDDLYVHLWNWGADYFLCREDQLPEHLDTPNMGMGGMT